MVIVETEAEEEITRLLKEVAIINDKDKILTKMFKIRESMESEEVEVEDTKAVMILILDQENA